MADTQSLYGNVVRAPGSSSKARVNDDELLYSTEGGFTQFGCTIKTGQGVLAIGTPLERDRATGLFVAAGTDTATVIAGPVTVVASTGVFTSPQANFLKVGDAVVPGTVTTTTGITAGTTYYVISTPSSTTFTLSATQGGSALSLTGNGSVAQFTLPDATATSGIKGFLRTALDSGAAGDIPKLGLYVVAGILDYTKIKAANGGTDLTQAQLNSIGARLNLDLNILQF